MRKVSVLVLFVAAGVCLQAQNLSWDVLFLKGNVKNTAQESISVNQIIKMETGEPFQIFITSASDCYSYVISYDSERKMYVLYNGTLKKDATFMLGPVLLQEPSGTEMLYVIMSLHRQDPLENFLQNYANNPDSSHHANNLRKEIIRLQNEVASLGEPASVFIPSGGTSRGDSQEHTNRFTGKSLYVRTITIRH